VPVQEPVEEINKPRFVNVDVDVVVTRIDIAVSFEVCAPDFDNESNSLGFDVLMSVNVRFNVSQATSDDDDSSDADLKNATCVGEPLNVADTVSQSSVASDPLIEAIRGTWPTLPNVAGSTYDVLDVIAPALSETVLSLGYVADVLGSIKVSREDDAVEFVSTRSAL
jgi:hypothetical protein